MNQESKEYKTYSLPLKDRTKKPIQKLVKEKKAIWLKKYQLTMMRKRVSVEISFTANYKDLGMLQFVIDQHIQNNPNYCLPQLSQAVDDARKRVDELTEKEYDAGKYEDWIREY
jgi:hypothetical protein